MNIVEHVPAPNALIEILEEYEEDLPNVTLVSFETELTRQPEVLGMWIPALGWIRIFLNSCINKSLSVAMKGFTWPAAVWFTLLYATMHELYHAGQSRDGRMPLTLNPNSPDGQYLEREANEWAMEEIIKQSDDWGVPKISEMGWVGSKLAEAMNVIFNADPNMVQEMLAFDGKNAAGLAAHLLTMMEHDPESYDRWLKQANERNGQLADGAYLTFKEGTMLLENDLSKGVIYA